MHPDPTLTTLYPQIIALDPRQRRELEAQLALLRASPEVLTRVAAVLSPVPESADALPFLAADLADRVESALADTHIDGELEDVTAVADYLNSMLDEDAPDLS